VAFQEGNAFYSLFKQRNDGKGKIWKVAVRNLVIGDKDLGFVLKDLAALPKDQWIYLDNYESGYSTDLRASKGEYRFYCEGHGQKTFRVVVGDSAFVMANVNGPAPATFGLGQNYPNPFNPMTTIKYQVPDFTGGRMVKKTRVTIDLYNIGGQQVVKLLDAPAKTGYYSVMWMGKDRVGKAVASGVYFYRITVMDYKGAVRFITTRKLVLLK
jgi:hypothetical protein